MMMSDEKIKKIPLRKCLGCNQMKPKTALIRIVKNKENEIKIDETGKKQGRGYYICKEKDCLVRVKKTKRIEKFFSKTASEDIYKEIGFCLEDKDGE